MKHRRKTRPASPAIVGKQVLAALKKGRMRLREVNAERQARGALLKRAITEFVLSEGLRGQPRRGRAGRIARKLNGLIGPRMVGKYLEQLTSSSRSTT